MQKRLIVPIIVMCVFVLAIVAFGNYSSVLLQAPLASVNPPLTPAQIATVRSDRTAGTNYWANGEDVYEEFDVDEMPKSVETHFKNRLKALGKLMIGCWALPNSNRPIDTNTLRNWGSRLEAAADRDDAADRTSSNPSDWNLESELNRVENEAKALIAAWCNLGQPANARDFCPCNYNCAGNDNTGKVWSATSWTCQNNCIAPATCQTATCTCVTENPKSQPSFGSTGKSN